MSHINTTSNGNQMVSPYTAPIPQAQQESTPVTEINRELDTVFDDQRKNIFSRSGRIADDVSTQLNTEKNITPEEAMALFGKINERLCLMWEIAAWKFNNRVEVEDIEQERRILKGAKKEAIDNKVDPAPYLKFIQAQMNAAKEIQTKCFDEWKEKRKPIPGDYRHIAETRKSIAPITNKITLQILPYLKTGYTFETMESLFIESLTTEDLSDEYKKEFFEKLVDIFLPKSDKATDSQRLAP